MGSHAGSHTGAGPWFWLDPATNLADALRLLAPAGCIVIGPRAVEHHGHTELAGRYADLFTDTKPTVTRHNNTMRTGQ